MEEESWINELPIAHQKKLVAKYPRAIRQIIKPADAICRIAMQVDAHAIDETVEISEIIQLELLKICGSGHFQHLKNPSLEVQDLAIELDPRNIMHIKNPSEDQMMRCIIRRPNLINMMESKFEVPQTVSTCARITL